MHCNQNFSDGWLPMCSKGQSNRSYRRGDAAPSFLKMADGARRTTTLLPRHAELMIALARACGYDMLADLLPIALAEGLRRSELYNLVWEHIDLLHWHIILRDTKDRPEDQRQRTITDPRPRTRRVLTAMLGRRTAERGPIFVDSSRRGFDRNGRGSPMSTSWDI
jgi:integrase